MMRKDFLELLNNLIDASLEQGYTPDDIRTALELKLMGLQPEEDEDNPEEGQEL